MHSGASPIVVASFARHPESTNNALDRNDGNDVGLSERGEAQLGYLISKIESLKPDLLICSPAARNIAVIKMADKLRIPIEIMECVSEWPRAACTLGKKNSDPTVAPILQRRIDGFGPGYEPLLGEDSFVQTKEKIELLSETLILRGSLIGAKKPKENGPPRIVVLTHGLFFRQFLAWVLAGGVTEDEQLRDFYRLMGIPESENVPGSFPRYFRDFYRRTGLGNAAILDFWYGHPFRSKNLEWNFEIGDVSHLPEELR